MSILWRLPDAMDKDSFLKALQEETDNFTKAVADQNGDWIVKGFIDVYKRIYTISVDTKVVSKGERHITISSSTSYL